MNLTARFAFISPLLISSALVLLQSPSNAAAVGAEEATRLLARSQALEAKCKFLTSSQHDELSGFVAKAEIAMVAKSSTANAKSIIASGRAIGRSAVCNNQEHADIIDILSAAHQATSGKVQIIAAPTPQPVEKKPVAIVAQAERPLFVRPLEIAPKPTVEPFPTTDALNHYAALTQHYYLVRRCHTMSLAPIASLYKDVVSSHHTAVASYGVPAVRAIMKQSESKAKASSCG